MKIKKNSPSILSRHLFTALLGSVSLIANYAYAGPVGGVVSGGSANIVGQGSSNVTVNQGSQNVVIDWGSFDTNSGDSVNFVQPNSNSVALNRIQNGSPTQFNGSLNANGNVIIMNGNGVVFGATANVDVNGMIATTSNISNEDFMNNRMVFDKAGNGDAAVINNGTINVKDSGLVGFVAPRVVNNGVINAKLGKVQLASGDKFTFDLYGDGLVSIAASDAVNTQLVQNTGNINADGGIIQLTAAQARDAVDSVIVNSGIIQARSIENKNGKIILSGGKHLIQSGKIDASGKASNQKGGTVELTSKDVVLKSGSVIDASGDKGGGTVLVGGDYQGKGALANAQTVTMESGSKIVNNAITKGDGGRTILWSDDTTKFAGSIEGKGGAQGGKGGFIETSGNKKLIATGSVDLRASDGSAGNWLLDPSYITIYDRGHGGTDNDSSFTTAYLEAMSTGANITLTADNNIYLDMNGDTLTLANNRNITLTAASGDINSLSTSSIVTSGTGSISLNAGWGVNGSAGLNLTAGTGGITLRANNNIYFENSTLITSGGNVIVNSDTDANGSGGVSFYKADIFTNGGNIVMGGGLNPLTDYAVGNDDIGNFGVVLDVVTLEADGGNIVINGKGDAPDCTNHCIGVGIYNANISTTAAGSITITGDGGGLVDDYGNTGIETYTSWFETENGDINLNGTTVSHQSNTSAILNGNSTFKTTGIGNINLKVIGSPLGSRGISNYGLFQTINGGNINIFTDRLFGGGSITSGNNLYIINQTAGITIGLGDDGSSQLQLYNDTLSGLSANNIYFGSSTAGVMTLGSDLTFNSNVHFNSLAGITLEGGNLNLAATKNATFMNDVTLADNQTITSSGNSGIINFNGTVNGGHDLTISAKKTNFMGAVGGSSALGNLTITSVDNQVLSSITTLAGKTVNATVTGSGNKLTTGAINTGTAGNITLTADDLTLNGALSGTGIITLQPYTNGRYVFVNYGTDNGSAFYLSNSELNQLSNGWGQIIIGRDDGSYGSASEVYVGNTSWIDPVLFRTAQGIFVYGTITGTDNASIGFDSTFTILDGSITTNNQNVNITGAFDNYLFTGANSFIETHGGNVRINSITTNSNSFGDQKLTVNTAGGNISVGHSGVAFSDQSGTAVNSTIILNAGMGNVLIDGINGSASDVTINAYNITLNGAWGNVTGDQGQNINTGNVTLVAVGDLVLPSITTSAGKTVSVTLSGSGSKLTTNAIAVGALGNIILTADDMDFLGELSGTGTLTLRQNDLTRNVALNTYGTDILDLSTFDLGNLKDGWGQIDIGRDDSTGGMMVGQTTWTDSVTFHGGAYMTTRGAITATDNASITFAGNGWLDLYNNITTDGGDVRFMNLGLAQSQSSIISYDGNINTNGGDFYIQNGYNFAGLSANQSITTNGGNITFNGGFQSNNSNPSYVFTVDAGTGTATFQDVETEINFDVKAGTIVLNDDWNLGSAAAKLTSTNAIFLPSITASSIIVQTTGATSDITINNGAQLNASATGNAITLASGRNFINNSDANAIVADNGRWLVYSQKPTQNTTNGLTPSGSNVYFSTYDANPPASIGAGSHFVFSQGNGLTLTITADNQTKTYGTANGTLTYTITGTYASGESAADITGSAALSTVVDNTTGAGSYVGGITIGEGTLNARSLGYDVVLVDGNYTVNKASLVITANDQSKTYGQNFTFNGNEFTQNGLVNGDTLSGVDLYSNGAAASANASGSPYAIVGSNAQGSGLSNYDITYTDGGMTVNKANLVITANDQSKTYGQNFTFNGSEFTQNGLVNGDTISDVDLNSSGAAASANASGSPYAIVGSNAQGAGLDNYNITYTNGGLTVNKANLVINANDQSKTYGQNFTFNGNEFTQNGLMNGDTITDISLVSGGAAGTANASGSPYAIVGSNANGTGLDNYNITYNDGNFTVNKASLTVTANNQNKTYGQNFTFNGNEFTQNGLVNGDSISNVGLASTGAAGTANASSTPYDIIVGGASGTGLSNYDITYVKGGLTVDKANLVITANNQNKNYGQNFTFNGTEFTHSGLFNSDTLTDVTFNSAGASSGSAAGSYGISGSGAAGSGLSNYNISYADGVMTVVGAPAPVLPDLNQKQLFTPMADTNVKMANSTEQKSQLVTILTQDDKATPQRGVSYNCLYTIISFSGKGIASSNSCSVQ